MMEPPAKLVPRDLDRPCQRAPLEGAWGRCAQSLQVGQDAGRGVRDTGSHPLWTAPPSSAWHQGPLALESGSRGRLTPPGRLSQSRRGPGMGEGGWDGGGGRLRLRLGPKLVLATQRPPVTRLVEASGASSGHPGLCLRGVLSGQPFHGQRENKGRVWWGAARGDPQVLGTRLICRAPPPLSPSRAVTRTTFRCPPHSG